MNENTKKPEPDFVIRLVGPNVRPWDVPFRILTRVMDAVQRLVDEKDDEFESDDTPTKQLIVSASQRVLNLIDVKSGSAAYRVAGDNGEEAIRVLMDTGRAMRHPSRAGWSYSALQSIKELSDTAKSLGCQIEFRLPGKGRQQGDVLATIKPETYDDISTSAFIFGETSVYGKIERVGGATEMHCGIRLHNRPRKMVICRVSGSDLVRELGQYLYQYVVVTGTATWVRHNMQLRHLTINSFEPPKEGSIRDALDRIYKAGGNAWDDIDDPDATILEMRGA